MRGHSARTKPLTWASKLKAMRVGDSFITNAALMKHLYVIARSLGVRLKARSQKTTCSVTASTIVRVEMVGQRPSREASPIYRERALAWRVRRKSFTPPMVHPLAKAFAAVPVPDGRQIKRQPKRWQKLLMSLKEDESFVAPAAMRTSIYKTAKRLGLRVKTRGTGGFDVVTQTPEIRVSLAGKAGKVGRPRLGERAEGVERAEGT